MLSISKFQAYSHAQKNEETPNFGKSSNWRRNFGKLFINDIIPLDFQDQLELHRTKLR